jgi:hypothetical protein
VESREGVPGLQAKELFDQFYAYLRKTADKDLLVIVEKEFISRAMKEMRENRRQASLLLGISRTTLQHRAKQLEAERQKRPKEAKVPSGKSSSLSATPAKPTATVKPGKSSAKRHA